MSEIPFLASENVTDVTRKKERNGNDEMTEEIKFDKPCGLFDSDVDVATPVFSVMLVDELYDKAVDFAASGFEVVLADELCDEDPEVANSEFAVVKFAEIAALVFLAYSP